MHTRWTPPVLNTERRNRSSRVDVLAAACGNKHGSHPFLVDAYLSTSEVS